MSRPLLDMEKKKAILIKQHPSSRPWRSNLWPNSVKQAFRPNYGSWGKGFVHFDSEP